MSSLFGGKDKSSAPVLPPAPVLPKAPEPAKIKEEEKAKLKKGKTAETILTGPQGLMKPADTGLKTLLGE